MLNVDCLQLLYTVKDVPPTLTILIWAQRYEENSGSITASVIIPIQCEESIT